MMPLLRPIFNNRSIPFSFDGTLIRHIWTMSILSLNDNEYTNFVDIRFMLQH